MPYLDILWLGHGLKSSTTTGFHVDSEHVNYKRGRNFSARKFLSSKELKDELETMRFFNVVCGKDTSNKTK